MKKVFRAFFVLALFLPLISMKSTPADAADSQTVDFVLHKIVFPDGQMPEASKNTGKMDDAHADLLKDYRGLNGVTFEVYDMSKDFYQLRREGRSVEDAQMQLSQQGPAGNALMKKVTASINDQDGTAEFSLPAKSGDQDAVYLFHESDAPENIKTHSQDMVAVLPMYDGDQPLSTIHLYPKNEEKEHQEPPFSKEIVDQHRSYQYGDVISYKVSTKIPADVLDYKAYKIDDQADDALTLNKDSLKLTIDGVDVSNQFDAKLSEHGYELIPKTIRVLGKSADKELSISYKMTLTNHQKIDVAILNTANLTTDHEKITKKIDIETGGKKFRKVDMNDFSKGLAGAKFVVMNQKGNYLTQTNIGYEWTTDEQAENLVSLVSGEDGMFEITGLPYGTYSLKETKAPTGYEKGNEPISFVVTESSYSTTSDVLKIVNNPKTIPPKEENPKIPHTPTGTPKHHKPVTPGRLPQTNDSINKTFIWIGGLLIVLVLFIVGKRRKNEK